MQQLTGLKIDHFLYVDLAGFQGVIDELDGVDMCITGENVNTPGYVESETADGTISEVYYNEPGHIVDPRDRARREAGVSAVATRIRRWPTSGPATSSATRRRRTSTGSSASSSSCVR